MGEEEGKHRQREEGKPHYLWQCCQCHTGWNSVVEHDICPYCSQNKCSHCEVKILPAISSRGPYLELRMVRPIDSKIDLAATRGGWSSEYGPRKHPQIYEEENRSYIQTLYGPPGPEDNIVNLFMQESSNLLPHSHRNDLVEQFFKNTSLADLQSSNTIACSQPDSLLDDRRARGFGNIDEDGGLCRSQNGPLRLSPRQLLIELRKPRYTTTTDTAGMQHVGRANDLPDADRRIIYIADANPWSILAIVATASTNQASAVQDFIYKYLDYQALFSVSIPAGAPRYALEVHLPYYAWRKGNRPKRDLREDGSARSLRKVRCVPFLHADSYGSDHSSCKEHIYQAQISFLVSGIDYHSWVGYCFVDTYHDGNDSEDAVQNYPSPTTSREPFLDPSSGRSFPLSPPLWSPRVYFLQVMQHRLRMVKDEWANVVSMIQFRLESYTQGEPLTRQLQELPNTDQRLEQLSKFYDRTHNTIRLLLDLKHTISKTVNAWDAFCEFELGYFDHKDTDTKDAESASSAIFIIRKHVKEISLMADALKNQESLCNNIASELEQHLTLENNRTTWIQLETGENVKSITYIAAFVSPPSVAAAIFSMGPDVLPFNLNLLNYFITLLILSVPMLFLVLYLRRKSRRKIGQTIRTDREQNLARPNQPFQDITDEESQIIDSSLTYETEEGDIELHNIPATSASRIL